MRQQDPKVGDIWLSEDRQKHMLIIAVDDEVTFTFRILEHGGEYMAGREWIKTHCLFYS